MSKFKKKPKKKVVPRTRKELRKDKRKEKKQRKLENSVNRTKPGRFVLNPSNGKNKTNDTETKENIKEKNTKQTKVLDVQAKQLKKELDEHKKLQREMSKQRRRQLKAANLDEDINIKQLEKQLKLNKRKQKTIPTSFATDGLDYLLEVCDSENMKSIAAAEQPFTDLNDAFDDDFALVTGKTPKKSTKNQPLDGSDDDISAKDSVEDELSEEESEQDSEELSNDGDEQESLKPTKKRKIGDKQKKNKKQISDDELSDDQDDDEKPNLKQNKKRKIAAAGKKTKKQISDDDEFSDDDFDEADEYDDSEESDKKNDVWEDIYGRTRNKDGSLVTESKKMEGKYIPPALRDKSNSTIDQKRAEKLARLQKQLKGLLNRLAESNMHNISTQIEDMYMSNSRNDMNETMTHLIFEALISPATTPERLLLEHVLLITILHANVGTEVGAHFLQTVIKKFNELFNKEQEVENKELDNSVHVIAELYNFKVFHSQLLYQILAKLSEKFQEKHVECILLVLKNVGFSLRKDDPLALKQLILDLQKKAATVTDNNSRVKYMLDILLAIKNNNVSKIPNYDTTYSEHLKKLQKNFVRKGNYVTQLNISLEDLLKADERGRWWIVGSAWTGTEIKSNKDNQGVDTTPSYNQKLIELAKKQRMNTDTRRNIFCALMTAENYTEAFEKILSLGLKNQQEREIIHVILHCSLQEKKYNPFYSLLAQKFCEYDRKYQMTIRCSIWDKLKTLTECSGNQISILSRLLTYLFLNQGLPISVLKVIQFSELDQVTLRLIRQVLIGVLLHDDQEVCVAVFEKVATSPKLKIFRESLRLFIHHFLLRNISGSELPDANKELLAIRAKLAEKTLTTTESKIKF